MSDTSQTWIFYFESDKCTTIIILYDFGRPPLLSSTHVDEMNPDGSSVVRDRRSTLLPNETSGKEVVGKRLRGKGRSSTAQQPMQQEEPEAQETHDTGMKAALLKKSSLICL